MQGIYLLRPECDLYGGINSDVKNSSDTSHSLIRFDRERRGLSISPRLIDPFEVQGYNSSSFQPSPRTEKQHSRKSIPVLPS